MVREQVTPAWWDDIWLNEAFADMDNDAYAGTENFPDWKVEVAAVNHKANVMAFPLTRCCQSQESTSTDSK